MTGSITPPSKYQNSSDSTVDIIIPTHPLFQEKIDKRVKEINRRLFFVSREREEHKQISKHLMVFLIVSLISYRKFFICKLKPPYQRNIRFVK